MPRYTGYTGITDNTSKVRVVDGTAPTPQRSERLQVSPWFSGAGDVLTARNDYEADVPKWYREPVMSDAERAFQMDERAGVTGEVVPPTRTPVKLSRAVFNDEYVPDQIASWRANKIVNMRRAR